MWLLLHVTLLLPFIIRALPTHHLGKSAAISASFEAAAPKPLLSFDNGNVGVNFLGYHASAGLGGLLSGDTAQGGLHAEAGTPHGQNAGAGLGGALDGSGKSAGGLYAGAAAGGGVGAGAGLAGSSSASGSYGGSYAGASSGGVETHITKISHKAPAPVVASGKFTASVAAPVVHKEIEIVEEQPRPQTTYIERTVIPNYVEKTVQVPTYVEKTIRVPTTVEKKIRVPAAPTIIEKTVEAPADVGVRGSFQGEVVKEAVAPHTVTGYGGGGYGGGYAGGFGGGFGGGYGGGYGGGFGGGGGGGASSGSFTVRKTANAGLFDDIFNIPISTLGAVNKLVNGIAGGGSVAVSKSFGVGGSVY